MHIDEKRILRAALCMTRQCWEQGMLSYGLLECLRLAEQAGWPQQAVRADMLQDLLEMVVYDMVLRQSADGRLCNVENTPAVTDSAFCIPAVLATGEKTGNERYICAAHKNAAYLLHEADRTGDGVLYHMRGTTQIWADSAAFLPYALVVAGHPDEGFRQLNGILDHLYIKESGLYAHILEAKDHSYPDKNAWSVGEGWILTGLERTWRALPGRMSEEKEELKARFTTLLEKVLSWQCEDGGFHDVMDDPATYQETEAPAMIACGIYAGILDGMLPADDLLLERADAMTGCVKRKILPDGRVIDAASSPFFDRPGTSVECQAHVLMLQALRDRLGIG